VCGCVCVVVIEGHTNVVKELLFMGVCFVCCVVLCMCVYMYVCMSVCVCVLCVVCVCVCVCVCSYVCVCLRACVRLVKVTLGLLGTLLVFVYVNT